MLERMQILIDTETRLLLTQKAANEGKSVSKVIRESLKKNNKKMTQAEKIKILRAFAEKTYKGKGVPNGNYDKYIYDL